MQEFSEPDSFEGPINFYRASFRDALAGKIGDMPEIDVDTLIIWGENDRALGKELTYGLERYFKKKYQIKYIPECSHWVQHDHPELVSSYIKEFVSEN